MSQGYDPTKPAYLDPLQSSPVRVNFNAVATCHAGGTSPPNPESGWLWLDTSDPLNYRLRIYLLGAWIVILNNLMGGAPAQGGSTKVVHNQTVPAAIWTVTHNLNTEDVVVQCWNNTGEMILPNTVQVAGVNSVVITLNAALDGTAVVLG